MMRPSIAITGAIVSVVFFLVTNPARVEVHRLRQHQIQIEQQEREWQELYQHRKSHGSLRIGDLGLPPPI